MENLVSIHRFQVELYNHKQRNVIIEQFIWRISKFYVVEVGGTKN